MKKLKAVRSFTGDENEGFVRRKTVFETTNERASALLDKNPKLVVPYDEPKAKEEKQAADKVNKEEKASYQTKEEKVDTSTKSKPGPKPKK